MNHPLQDEWKSELRPDDKLVDRGRACPQCGERREDELHLAEDRVAIDCATCGCVFVPKGGS